MCKHVPANCQPALFPLVNDSVLLIPSVDLVKYFKLTNSSIKFLNELSVKQCFRYFPTGKGNNELYALCLKNQTYETTTVTYKIRYTDDFRLAVSQYGYGYGTRIDFDSPLVVTFNDSNDPIVLYIATNVRNEDMLYIKDLNAGGDVCDHISLPSDCTGPYKLKHLYHRIALLKCSNGLAYFYDSDTNEFVKLLVQGITMVERCANSSFFVVITTQGNILLNKTTSDSWIRIPFFKVTVNSFQLDTISSFACHWNGTATILYFTVLQDDGMMYYVYIPLEHVAKLKSFTEAHRMLKLSTHGLSHTLQSSIVGSAWVTKLTDDNNNIQKTVLINIQTKISGSHSSNGLPYVLSYQNNSFHSNTIKVKEVTESRSENYKSKGFPQFGIGILASVCALIAVIVLVILTIVLHKYCKRERPKLCQTHYSRVMERNGEELPAEELDTPFNDGDEVENQPTSQTVGHNSDVSDENNGQTNEEATAPPVNQDLSTAAGYCNDQLEAIVHPQAALDFQPQAAAESIGNAHNETLEGNHGNNRFNYSVPSEFTPTEEATSQTDNSGGQRVTGALTEVVSQVETRAMVAQARAPVDGQGSDDECSDP